MRLRLNNIRFKNFSMDDYDAVVKLWKLSGLPIKDKGRDHPEKIKEELKRGIAHFILVEQESILIGVGLITHDGRKGWINRVAVHPDCRKQGIARLIVKKAEEHLNKIGIGIIACLIEDYNKDSLAAFQKMGYNEFPKIHYLTKRKHLDI